MSVKRYAEIIVTVYAPVPATADLDALAARAEADLRTKVRTAIKAKAADINSRHSIRYWKQDD